MTEAVVRRLAAAQGGDEIGACRRRRWRSATGAGRACGRRAPTAVPRPRMRSRAPRPEMATCAPGRSLTSPSQRLAETAGAASSAMPMAARAPGGAAWWRRRGRLAVPGAVRCARAHAARLVLEVAAVREDHRDAGGVGGLDDLVVAHRAAGLDDRGDAGVDRELRAVGEREERVGGERAARSGRRPVARALSIASRTESTRLIWPAPMPDRREVAARARSRSSARACRPSRRTASRPTRARTACAR